MSYRVHSGPLPALDRLSEDRQSPVRARSEAGGKWTFTAEDDPAAVPLTVLVLAQGPQGKWLWNRDAGVISAAQRPVLSDERLDEAMVYALADMGVMPRSFRLVEPLGTVESDDMLCAVWQVLVDESAAAPWQGFPRDSRMDPLTEAAWRLVTG
jgi:hypothetical protein